MNSNLEKKPNLESLTGVRFIAALLVVIFHYGRKAVPFDEGWAHGLAGVGLLAVGFFFVLSGFILAYVYESRYQREEVSVLGFYRARFARIYPVYLLAAAFAVILLLRYRPFTPEQAADYVGKVSAAVMMFQSWVPSFPMTINGPGWTVSVEAFFYALFPMFFGVVRKWRTPVLVVAFAAAWLLGSWLTWQCYYQWFTGSQPPVVRELQLYYPPLHLGSFLVGVVTGLLARRNLFQRFSGWPATLGLVVVSAVLLNLAGVFDLLNQWSMSGWQRTYAWVQLAHNGLIAPFWALFLICLLYSYSWVNKLLGNPLMRFLGGASYAFYILQFPVWVTLKQELFIPREWTDPSLRFGVLLMVLTPLACLVFKFVEQPMRRRLTRVKRQPEAAQTDLKPV